MRPAMPQPVSGSTRNVKAKKTWIFVGAIVCGVIVGCPPLYAQVTGAPSTAGGNGNPWDQGVPIETREAAREVFLEGNRLFKIPLFAQAIEKYTEALSRWKHPAFYFNLALAQLNLGQDLEARNSLEQAMKYGAEPLGADEFQEAKKQLREVEHRLGRIRVSCPTPGAEITLDGVTLFIGPGSQETWVKAQVHEVTAKRSQYVTQVKHVTVAPGAKETLDLPLRKLFEDRPWAPWMPWAVVGSGAAVAAAGGVLHALSARDFHAYDSGFVKLLCAPMGCTEQAIDEADPDLSPKLSRARLEQKIAVGGYIAGGAAIAAGVVLLYLNRPHLAEQEGENPRATGAAMVPVVSAEMLGVLVTVSH